MESYMSAACCRPRLAATAVNPRLRPHGRSSLMNPAGRPKFLPRPSVATLPGLQCKASSSLTAAPANFHPSLWGDFFIKYNQPLQMSDNERIEERENQLKEEVNGMFQICGKDVVKMMNLVDALQRLGIDHHFEGKIAAALSKIHVAEFDSASLYDVALRFRLLRQHGLWVSPDVFNKFRCEDGCFMSKIESDPKGLLCLYNAAHLLTHNEVELEEAISFARHHLELMRGSLEFPLSDQVARALVIPLPRTVKRIEALSYMSEYNGEEQSYNPSILELAKIDFNLLQQLHKKELKAISQWWEDLSRDVELEYVRDRIVETYFFSYTVYHEKEHARARMIFTKLLMLISLLDDTFDVHATLEECRKLNEAIQRWDESAVSIVPEYLKKYFLEVLSNYKEFEDALETHEKYRGVYNRKAFQVLSTYYLQEAEWFHQNHLPSFDDQVNVSSMTGGCQAFSVGLLVGMGNAATKEAFDWAFSCSDSIRAYGELIRFMDDMAAFKNGKNKKDVANTIECYVEEHGVTGEVAVAKIESLVEGAWRTMNRARFEHRDMLPVLQRVDNMTTSTALLLHGKTSAYTNSKGIKQTIERHFVNPIPL